MTLPAYKPPTINTQRAQTFSIPITFTINGPARATGVSSPIPFPFRITKIFAATVDNVAVRAQYYFFVSDNDNTPTNAPPPDENVLTPVGGQNFVSPWWNYSILELDLDCEVQEENKRLKFYIDQISGGIRVHQAIFVIERLA